MPREYYAISEFVRFSATSPYDTSDSVVGVIPESVTESAFLTHGDPRGLQRVSLICRVRNISLESGGYKKLEFDMLDPTQPAPLLNFTSSPRTNSPPQH
jgi:hypothetical protein